MEKHNPEKKLWIDLMKGLLILLMVLGHTYVSYKKFIYLFHMAAFFMVSGYCWNEKHAKDLKTVKAYFFQKVRRLYLPFVLINVCYIVFNNVFIDTGIYSNAAVFLDITVNSPVKQELSNYYSFSQTIKAILRAVCFAGGSARLCGATWFLSALFIVSIFHCVTDWLLEKTKLKKDVVYASLLCVCLAWVWLADHHGIRIIGPVDRFPSAYSAYIMGVLLRRTTNAKRLQAFYEKRKLFLNAVLLAGSFGVLLLYYVNGFHVELAYSQITNPIGYFICSISGWYFIKSAAFFLSKCKAIAKLFQFFGNRTIPILLFHTLAFKLASLIYISATSSERVLLASYPVIFLSPEWYRYVYAFVGIALPIISYQIYGVGKAKFIKAFRRRRSI